MREWDEAMAWVDRMIEWALAMKRVELIEAAGIRLQILAVMPTRSEFATGRWAPTPVAQEDIEAGQAFLREVDAWERSRQQSERRGT